MLTPFSQMYFSSKAQMIFGTDNNAYSNRYHRGLFHGVTHGQRKKRVFSMKYRIETQKPNIFKKNLRSDILNQNFKLWISMRARKCIMKKGSLDNYLLTTKPSQIDSKFGLYLRSLIQDKLKDPENFIPPAYIQGTAKIRRVRRSKMWEYKQIPTVYIPAHVKANADMSEFYLKSPNEMSRHELQDLERLIADLQAMDENEEYTEDDPKFGKAQRFINQTAEIEKLKEELK